MKQTPCLFVVIYGHPESYPPTLNAISCLAGTYSIKVLHRAHQQSEWSYPNNVELFPDGNILTAREQEKLTIFAKIGLFCRFSYLFFKLQKRYKPDLILFYDGLSLLSYYLFYFLLDYKPKLWYHSHDMYDPQYIRKYSLAWWSLHAEKWFFPKLTVFSLPALERQSHFPMSKLGGTFFLLPNFPSLNFYRTFYKTKSLDQEFRLIFQGQVGAGHGIEEILSILPIQIKGKSLKLILKGIFRDGYDQTVLEYAKIKGIEKHIEIHGFTPYINVPELGATCHVGLAVFTKQDIMNESLGTAWNKIYEYAALGLPILYFDNDHFRKYLDKYIWAIPTDLSRESIILALGNIVDNYQVLSQAAHDDFLTDLNFEYNFEKIQLFLQKNEKQLINLSN